MEYWSGNSKTDWHKKRIASAGIYGFNFRRGLWSLAEVKKGRTARAGQPAGRTVVRQPARTIVQQRIARPIRRYWEDDVEVDFDKLDLTDSLEEDGTLDLGDAVEAVEDYAVNDLDIDTEHYDLGGYDDFGGYDNHIEVEHGDVGDDDGYYGDDDFGDLGGFDDFDF